VRAILNDEQFDSEVCHCRSLHRAAETGGRRGRRCDCQEISVARTQGSIKVS
jgi:hypothetical protein